MSKATPLPGVLRERFEGVVFRQSLATATTTDGRLALFFVAADPPEARY